MSFLELAARRCSVRAYLETAVDEKLLKSVLEAARLAPSACNNQPLALIVIRDKDSRRKLETAYNRDWFLNAPIIIAACCDRRSAWVRGDGKAYGDVDVAIALDHMTLAAAELGLGTCWVGAFKVQEARTALMLPAHIDPVAFTPLGYPAPAITPKLRKSLDEIVHWEYYGGKNRAASNKE